MNCDLEMALAPKGLSIAAPLGATPKRGGEFGESLFSLPFLEGLNAEYVKGENMEAVVTEEPQGKMNLCF